MREENRRRSTSGKLKQLSVARSGSLVTTNNKCTGWRDTNWLSKDTGNLTPRVHLPYKLDWLESSTCASVDGVRFERTPTTIRCLRSAGIGFRLTTSADVLWRTFSPRVSPYSATARKDDCDGPARYPRKDIYDAASRAVMRVIVFFPLLLSFPLFFFAFLFGVRQGRMREVVLFLLSWCAAVKRLYGPGRDRVAQTVCALNSIRAFDLASAGRSSPAGRQYRVPGERFSVLRKLLSRRRMSFVVCDGRAGGTREKWGRTVKTCRALKLHSANENVALNESFVYRGCGVVNADAVESLHLPAACDSVTKRPRHLRVRPAPIWEHASGAFRRIRRVPWTVKRKMRRI